ncbi:glycosyltransferase family 2 protein [Butyrivibrio sp. MC2021]|uniref:glycosyltransferase family 2 protein n=1 Tax=Butyrivibrio sp. MC2021 TaxID=1408306 RepID=UPI0006877A86|nr:glycosyltransferase family 2 protein [Butyrivibrio sp. MC2021]
MKDLISIIVPSYNVEKFLDACVDSICSQTYDNLEIILVDDGSTDSTGALCDSWKEKDSRIRVIHQENRGLSGARNAGIRAAKGEYLSFIDSDDIIAPDYVEVLYSCICEGHVTMAQGRSNNFHDPAETETFQSTYETRLMDSRDMCHELMTTYHKGWGIVMTKMFHRSLFEHLEFPVGRIHEDEYLVYRLIWEARKVALSDRIIYYYRSKREGSITHSGFSVKRLDVLDARKKRCEFFKSLGESSLYGDALLSYCQAQTDCLKKLKKSDMADKEKYIADIEKDLKKGFRTLKGISHISQKKKLSLWLDIYMPWAKGFYKGLGKG